MFESPPVCSSSHMNIAPLSPAAMQIVAWLGEVGARWGLPVGACRAHAVLYLTATPMPAGEIAALLGLGTEEATQALDRLKEQGLIVASPAGWRTGVDPWALMLQALETRRRHELGEARSVIDQWRRDCGDEDSRVLRQTERLFDLVEDIAAIDAGTRGLSPATTRRLIGIGGQAARLFDRTIRARGRR